MLLTSILALVAYGCVVAIYRLYFHPLSKFPGPKLAAITSIYEFYYNVLKDGLFVWEIEKMHREYGPIVRINPHELHINDHSFYDEIYTSSSSRRDKYWPYVKGLALPRSVVSTVPHQHHAIRRKHLSNFFSAQVVRSIEPLIHDHVAKLINRLAQFHRDKQTVDLNVLFNALTIDIISHYAYGANFNFLESGDLQTEVRESLIALTSGFHLMRFVPLDPTLIEKVPIPLLELLWPSAGKLMSTKRRIRAQAIDALGGVNQPEKETIFSTLVNSDLEQSEKSVQRLEDEAFLLLQAGSETTGHSLGVLMFYVLRDREVYRRVKEELLQVMPDPESKPSLAQLRALSYFSAVITESFRLAFGTMTRLPRVAPDEALVYKQWTIPPGTPLSQTAYLIHMDPSVFPEPEKFDPERWIRAGENRKKLESVLVNWSKGRRQCLGINLAYAEVYLAASQVFRRTDLTLLDTSLKCIQPVRDRIIILPESGGYHIRVAVDGVQ
ncbi:hypothetical protein FE257_012188 [Aspergillus nanangensis]|uniref:Cytochrome P450 n=1 Tax=Aspergillus nanangensis TaxID=2582783 RepID=A0AAD4CI00_ASPNN|nr:hypothetical protein FE257_012188 [Aspergillus nanangensis]